MPVSGTNSKSISNLQFKWNHISSIFSLFIAAVLVSYSLLVGWNTLSNQAGFSSAGLSIEQWKFLKKYNFIQNHPYFPATFIFYASNTCIFICFLALAKKWKELMTFWTDSERILPTFRNSKLKRNFIFKIRSIAFTVLSLALSMASICRVVSEIKKKFHIFS